VSVAAGRTITKRIAEACGGKITPAGILQAGPTRLKAAGTSPQKLAYLTDLATKATTGEIRLSELAKKSDDEVIEELTRVKGIGVWTAKMYLIFHLGRPDVVAHEDLGLQIAVSKAYKVSRGRAAKRILKLGAAWSPYSSVAALTLWNWLHVNGKKA
jgi:DNA-3-methyladenine glycosylase II